MKTVKWFEGYYAAVAAAILVAVPFAYGNASSKVPSIVTRNCSGCHGLDGNSQLPYFPRIAGLTAVYSERKLLNFRTSALPPVDEAITSIAHIGRARKEPGITAQASEYMVGISHAISDQDAKLSAQWYAGQEPGVGRSGNPKLIAEGKELFLNGLKSQGLIACKTCHGPDARGTGMAPRLAGQNAAYLVGQLSLFHAGDRHHSPEMTAVAQNVEGEQARAVAAYLQSR